jgi:hypothetical protein
MEHDPERASSEEYIAHRKRNPGTAAAARAYDLCEMTVAANYTGLAPMVDTLVHAPLRITEIPVAYCHQGAGRHLHRPRHGGSRDLPAGTG